MTLSLRRASSWRKTDQRVVTRWLASTGELPWWLTISRASAGHAVTRARTLQAVPANVARFNYFQDAELVVESASTSLTVTPNNPGGGGWLSNVANRVANSAVAPDGTMTATTLTISGSQTVWQSHAIVAGSINSASIFLKAGTSSRPQLFNATAANTIAAIANIDLVAGTCTLATQGGATDAFCYMTPYGDGWWRATVIGNLVSSTSGFLTLGASMDGTILAWGAAYAPGAFTRSFFDGARAADTIAVAPAYQNLPAMLEAYDITTRQIVRRVFPAGLGATLPLDLSISRIFIYAPTTSAGWLSARGAPGRSWN